MDDIKHFEIEFVQNCCFRMDESLRMIQIALERVSEAQVWQKPNSSLNSIGNLILHLCGNMTQYGIASLEESEDQRERDKEFTASSGYTKGQLLALLEETMNKVKDTFNNTTTERFLKQKQVQGFRFSGIGNCIHVVEHFSYHTGQIAFWVKQLHNEQLGFYDGHDLTMLNDK